MSKRPPQATPRPPSAEESPQSEEALAVKPRIRLQRPPMYRLLLLNDDFTPMPFVVAVLRRFFHKNLEEATEIMLQVHHKGAASCGVFTREVAETKAEQLTAYARRHAHPLQCRLEQA